MTAGRVGRPHGRDGSFYVDGAEHELPAGTVVVVAGDERRVERRAGTDERPLVRLSALEDPRAVRGEPLLVDEELADDEWLASDLVGCRVEGLGTVRRVIRGSSCDVLEVDDGALVPFVSDAVVSVDAAARTIRVDLDFLSAS